MHKMNALRNVRTGTTLPVIIVRIPMHITVQYAYTDLFLRINESMLDL